MIFQRIKQVRQQLDLTQVEFGKKLGVSRDVISNLEQGRVEAKEPFIDLMCGIFSVNKEWLLTGTGEAADASAESRRNIFEAVRILEALEPQLQDYALEQIRGLLKVQRSLKQ